MIDVPTGARRVRVGTDRLPRWLTGFAARHGPTSIEQDATTVHLTGGDGHQAWLTVPFPPLAGELLDHIQPDRTVGVLLVQRGGYAVGVFSGRRLIASKVGTGYVQGGTSAGGWSQQRFARRRANQAGALFGRATEVAATLLVAHRLDALAAGGDRPAVEAVLADRRLSTVRARLTGPWLTGPDPRLKVLAATPDQFLSVTIALVP